ncbi:uncharacterized protein B0H18DRAFT_952675 [Fomitopsis serialis]|uniref:uncharacterized protein n=1 Tax=Fomitopsis serialis TaxID=139415 RepID=UPI00200812BC|nr:uncharacterized protein B0H18DRAFT_952675 [Neoantrodia serialis]KAH9931489.1 hypothetical protein B0H18DRAFT_952675 [Neoantrodia serialis]
MSTNEAHSAVVNLMATGVINVFSNSDANERYLGVAIVLLIAEVLPAQFALVMFDALCTTRFLNFRFAAQWKMAFNEETRVLAWTLPEATFQFSLLGHNDKDFCDLLAAFTTALSAVRANERSYQERLKHCLANIPSNVPANVPPNMPMNVSANVPSNVPANVPSNMPVNVSASIPANVPSVNIPADVLAHAVATAIQDISAYVPGDVSQMANSVMMGMDRTESAAHSQSVPLMGPIASSSREDPMVFEMQAMNMFADYVGPAAEM